MTHTKSMRREIHERAHAEWPMATLLVLKDEFPCGRFRIFMRVSLRESTINVTTRPFNADATPEFVWERIMRQRFAEPDEDEDIGKCEECGKCGNDEEQDG